MENTPSPHALHVLDQTPFSGFHARAMITTGMGVFTDGYDLISISVVLPLVLHSLGVAKLTGFDASLLGAVALLGSAAGALLFGALSNAGRKRYYGIDVMLMAVAALAQAFVGNLWQLIAVRALLGIGVGADYVLSPMIMAEHANARDRKLNPGLYYVRLFMNLLLISVLTFFVIHTVLWLIRSRYHQVKNRAGNGGNNA